MQTRSPSARHKILVVDDEQLNRKILTDLLHQEHTVVQAKNGVQALQKAQQHVPDLVLLDVRMPGMDGYEVLRRLKSDERTHEIPVIFISAHDSALDEETGLLLGASDYIIKPFHASIVRARVNNHLKSADQRKLLEQFAHLDGLTGIHNRRRFDEVLASEWQRASHNRDMLSLALLDIDFFKEYNDHYGHSGGDDTLRIVARALTAGRTRPDDFVGRYGGEEFVLLLPHTDQPDAIARCETLRTAIETLCIPHARSSVSASVTISIGIASMQPRADTSPTQLLNLADTQLYRAKTQGRNRLEWARYAMPHPSAALKN